MNNFALPNDDFNRQIIVDKLLKLLQANIDISPVLLNGGWGTGKSVFANRMVKTAREKYLSKDEKFPQRMIYIDAYKSDYLDNPLVTILAAIDNLLHKEAKSFADEFRSNIKPIGSRLLKIAANAGSRWILKESADYICEEIQSELKDSSKDAINNAVDYILKDTAKAEGDLNTLIEALSIVTEHVPLIIIIDELDRCRPDYALSLLETIKHVFEMKHIQIVLVTNLQQLEASINHAYGVGIDAQNYLDKFIKYRFDLPVTISDEQDKYIPCKHCESLLREIKYLNNDSVYCNSERVISFLLYLIEINNLSLRQVESYCRALRIYWTLFQDRHDYNYKDLELILVSFSIYLYVFHQNESYLLTKNFEINDSTLKVIYSVLGITKKDSELLSGTPYGHKASNNVVTSNYASRMNYEIDYKSPIIKLDNYEDNRFFKLVIGRIVFMMRNIDTEANSLLQDFTDDWDLLIQESKIANDKIFQECEPGKKFAYQFFMDPIMIIKMTL